MVGEFERLDAAIVPAIKSGSQVQAITAALEAKKEVKRFLAENRPLNVDSALALKLKKIRDNYGYTLDAVLKIVGDAGGEDISQEAEDGIDFIDKFFTEGTADYVDEGFFERRNQVGTLVVSESLPDNFLKNFNSLRECYALGLFETTLVYCRAVIETGCFEALVRRGVIPRNRKVDDFREFSLKHLMRSVKEFVYRESGHFIDWAYDHGDIDAPRLWDRCNELSKEASPSVLAEAQE